MSEEPVKVEENWRNPDGTLKEGHPPLGHRPKGKTMKEFAREFLMSMSDEDKIKFLNSLSKDIVWKMAEGNPQTDITSGGKEINPIPIYGGLSTSNSDQKDIQPEKKD